MAGANLGYARFYVVTPNTRNEGIQKMEGYSLGSFKQKIAIRDLRQENEQLKARVSELETVLEQHNIHLLDKNCWCKPEVENVQ